MERIYLDHSATTPVAPEVLEAMLPYLRGKFGNPGSLHSFGQETKAAVQEAREHVAALVGARPSEIIFTSGGTEADNLAIKGVAHAHRSDGRHIVTTSIEHHAVEQTCHALAREGFDVTVVPTDRDGLISPEAVEAAIRPDTILVSVMAANNEVGTVEPFAALGKIAHDHGIPFHTDAVQAIGKVPIDVGRDHIDLLALSGHKFHAPKGVGALYVRDGLRLEPELHGGGQEHGLRSSTLNVPGIVGLGKAAAIARAELDRESQRLGALRDRLFVGVLVQVPRAYITGHRTQRLPNHASFRFEGLEGDELVLQLDLRGIAASSGAACLTGSAEPSPVLLALGYSREEALSGLRLSLGRGTTEGEITRVLELLPGLVEDVRRRHRSGRHAG